MASIERLAIRGIRSFSPEDDEQVVQFFSPITIIVGANGCGKTTIIEALKFAITGAFPPGGGARSGAYFVHDARSLGQPVVKASIKLRFHSTAGKTCVLVRNMEVTHKKTTTTFRQLEGALRVTDAATGQRTTLSHKCADLDREIPPLLGIAKPILEHVVFCHQEDASWPLQEGAVLKKRFDEIFDSTRYTKALDVVKKYEKEMQMQVKDLKATLAELSSHLHAAKGFRADLERSHQQLEQLESEMDRYSREIKGIEEAIQSASVTVTQLEEMDSKMENLERELAHLSNVIEKQRGMMEDEFVQRNYTVQQLQSMLRDYDDQMSNQVERKAVMEQDMERLDRDIEKVRQDEMALTSLMGKNAAEREAHDLRVKERLVKLEAIAQKYSLDLQTSLSQQSQVNMSFATAQANSQDAGSRGGASQDTTVTLSKEDMQSLFQLVQRKEEDLKSSIKAQREQTQAHEDEFQAALTDLGGKLRAYENEQSKITKQKQELQAESTQLSKSVSQSRLRKADVEAALRKAEAEAKKLEDLNSDPRKSAIPLEIRETEEKIDKIKRKIDDDRMLLDSLRHSADTQNSIAVLEEQCVKDFETMEESLREQTFAMQKFNLELPDQLPGLDGDDKGDGLVAVMDSIAATTLSKLEEFKTKLARASDETSKTQRLISEKNAYLTSAQRSVGTLRGKLDALKGVDGSISQVRRLVETLRSHEAELGLSITASEETPRELLQYLDERIASLEEDAPDINAPAVAKKLLKELKKMAKVTVEGQLKVQCPCCLREMKPEETEKFVTTMNKLADDSHLVKQDPGVAETYQRTKTNYLNWRKILSDRLEDLRDAARLTEELAQSERDAQKYNDEISTYRSILAEREKERSEIQIDYDALRQLSEVARRWQEDSGRIAERKISIQHKQLDLSASTADPSRDLRTVEREMASLMDEKDALTNKINRLNQEMSRLNSEITHLTTISSNLAKLAREREARFDSEQKSEKRKAEIRELLEKLGEEEKVVLDHIGIIRPKIRAKEAERQRWRNLAREEEMQLVETFNLFSDDVKHLRILTQQIDDYLESAKVDELRRLETRHSKLLDRIEEIKKEQKTIRPELDALTKAVDDQERYKKQLRQMIEIIEAEQRKSDLKKEMRRLKDDRLLVQGYETAYDVLSDANAKKDNLVAEKARIEGRRGEIIEQIRSLQRKLASPEYKNVDEQNQDAMIKYQTTQTGCEDLKNYSSALDKALLQFHGVKIAEINKRIHDLWLATYKGEDIANIEIVSGQEPGSRAAKSYNYRVVMTKGSAQMDMRGRCSAGQRVLASIVIRLALAETFGVYCGCIALDEPTVNLDEANKKGLAVALAQLVSARAQQRNFQLILITHDEDFVSMMKTELATLTGFSMPDKYFQVRREQSHDGKYYSKIKAIDWSELV